MRGTCDSRRLPRGSGGHAGCTGGPAMLGEAVGNYRVMKKLGEGGMGVVYLAEHALIGRKAAVKVLLPVFSSVPSGSHTVPAES